MEKTQQLSCTGSGGIAMATQELTGCFCSYNGMSAAQLWALLADPIFWVDEEFVVGVRVKSAYGQSAMCIMSENNEKVHSKWWYDNKGGAREKVWHSKDEYQCWRT